MIVSKVNVTYIVAVYVLHPFIKHIYLQLMCHMETFQSVAIIWLQPACMHTAIMRQMKVAQTCGCTHTLPVGSYVICYCTAHV